MIQELLFPTFLNRTNLFWTFPWVSWVPLFCDVTATDLCLLYASIFYDAFLIVTLDLYFVNIFFQKFIEIVTYKIVADLFNFHNIEVFQVNKIQRLFKLW